MACIVVLTTPWHYRESVCLLTAPPTLPPPPGNCTATFDLIFVLDASGSIGSTGFEQIKLLVSGIVNNLDIENGSARVGLLMYSTDVDARFNLSTYATRAEVQAAIAELTFTAGLTNTADALAHVRQVMLLPAAGARDDAANVVVVMTDAGSNDKRATQVGSVIHMELSPTVCSETRGSVGVFSLLFFICLFVRLGISQRRKELGA